MSPVPERPVTLDWTNARSILFVLAAVAIFSLIFISGRFTGDLASPLQIMFLRYLGGLLTVIVIALMRRESLQNLQSEHRLNQAVRALAGGLGVLPLSLVMLTCRSLMPMPSA